MKKILSIAQAPAGHWVGDGFPVQSMFSYQHNAEAFSPFLMLDYAAPTSFTPNTGDRRGVGAHPHRGFETVTIVYAGEVEHRDSTGHGGVISTGDVQWMTAGSGIAHDEFHSEKYSHSGGPFQMVQLWVNLPAKDKMAAPGYQAITDASIPSVPIGDNAAGSVRVIAGEYSGHKGPAHTFTQMNVLDIQLGAGRTIDLPQPDGWTTLLLVQEGALKINDSASASKSQLVMLSREGNTVKIAAEQNARVLLLAGQPIDEPIVGYGPFVMNSRQEIERAINDFNSGKFGQIN
ncbi:MAG: pirin family protein [Burkholderiales bacterium]